MPMKFEDYASRVQPRSRLEWELDSGGINKHITEIGMDMTNLDELTAELEIEHKYLRDIREQYKGANQRYYII